MGDETTKNIEQHDEAEFRAQVDALNREQEAAERRRFREMVESQRRMEDNKAKVKRDLGLDDNWQPLRPKA